MKTTKFDVLGMSCAACSYAIENTLLALKGIEKVNVSLLSNSMIITYNENVINAEKIEKAVANLGYKAIQNDRTSKKKNSNFDETSILRKRLFFSIVFTLPLFYLTMGEMLGFPIPSIFKGRENALSFAFTQFLLALIVAAINNVFFKKGFFGIIKGHATMDSLIAIGSFSSIIYGVFSIYKLAYFYGNNIDSDSISFIMKDLYFESSATILTLVTLGKYLENKAKRKTMNSISQLMGLAPETAVVIRDDKEVEVKCEDIKVGDIVCIKAGDRLPVDGILIEGRGLLDEAAITGESMPVEKTVDSYVVSASINLHGFFKFRASKVGEDTTFSKIVALVKEAADSSAPIAHLADKVALFFVPSVIMLSILSLIIWLFATKDVSQAFSTAISVLVISCPCALGLATPTAIMVGMGNSARLGILIKSGEALETFNKVGIVAFDKTGTITKGRPQVESVHSFSNDFSTNDVLKIAFSIEEKSSHPIAFSIISEAKRLKLEKLKVEDFENLMSRGVKGKIEDKCFFIGNQNMMTAEGFSLNEEYCSNLPNNVTPLFVCCSYENGDKKIVGLITIKDKIKEDAANSISYLNHFGIKTVMLTGDRQEVAKEIANEVGIRKVHASCMPDDKVGIIKELKKDGSIVAMIGDGINDAPSLATADVGIAIGNGQDIAIESADIILMNNDIYTLINALRLSKFVMKIIKQNLFWALFYNSLCIPVAMGVLYPIFGIRLSPSLAALAMSFSSVSVVLNALRINGFREKNRVNEKTRCPLINQECSSSNDINNLGGSAMKSVFVVEDMACKHCVARIENSLNESYAEKLINVSISLEDKTVSVEYKDDISEDSIMSKIKDAGYTPVLK